MANITLKDLKFIDDVKNRKAFLIALREVEEEGYLESDVKDAARKIHEIEKQKPQNPKTTAEELAKMAVGTTPAERAFNNVVKKRNFTNTNAVDMKDYKYWRDQDFGKSPSKPVNEVFRPRHNNVLPNPLLDDDDENESVFARDSAPTLPKRTSLYDELFGSISKDHEVSERPKRTPTDIYKMLDDRLNDVPEEDKLANSSAPQTKSEPEKKAGGKYQSQEYKELAKKRSEEFKKRAEEREKSKREKELDEKEKKLEEERKELQAKRVKLEAMEAEAKANQEKTKLVVEVVAPEAVIEKPKKTTAKKSTKSTSTKKSTASKPKTTRKRKKKLDADIKLYKHIVID